MTYEAMEIKAGASDARVLQIANTHIDLYLGKWNRSTLGFISEMLSGEIIKFTKLVLANDIKGITECIK